MGRSGVLRNPEEEPGKLNSFQGSRGGERHKCVRLREEQTGAWMELVLVQYQGTGRLSDNWDAWCSSRRGSLVSSRHARQAAKILEAIPSWCSSV